MKQPLSSNKVWKMGSDVLCQKLLDTHDLIHDSRNELEFQLVNIALMENRYYGNEPYLSITMMCPPGNHRMYVNDFRHNRLEVINPYLPTCYLTTLNPVSHVYIHHGDSIHTKMYSVPRLYTSGGGQHIIAANAKGKLLESFWPTYDINKGVHLCRVKRGEIKPTNHNLIKGYSPYASFEADALLNYLATTWTNFWSSTFTYTEQAISDEAFHAAKIEPSTNPYTLKYGWIDINGRYRLKEGYDCMSLLLTACEKRIPWNKYPQMNQANQKLLRKYTGLTEDIMQSRSRYLAVKKQITNLSIPINPTIPIISN